MTASGRLQRLNLFEASTEFDPELPVPFQRGRLRVGDVLGGEKLGGSLFDLPPGQAVCPYHFETPNEEWLIVLVGHPTVRHPGGEDRLAPGDVVTFLPGPDGAHQVRNDGTDPVRVLIMSTKISPDMAIYPDSDKVGVYFDDGSDLLFRRSSAVDYFDGEA